MWSNFFFATIMKTYLFIALSLFCGVAHGRAQGRGYPYDAHELQRIDKLCDDAGRYAANAARLRNGGFDFKWYETDFDTMTEIVPDLFKQRPLAMKVGKMVYDRDRLSASDARRIIRDSCYENPALFSRPF